MTKKIMLSLFATVFCVQTHAMEQSVQTDAMEQNEQSLRMTLATVTHALNEVSKQIEECKKCEFNTSKEQDEPSLRMTLAAGVTQTLNELSKQIEECRKCNFNTSNAQDYLSPSQEQRRTANLIAYRTLIRTSGTLEYFLKHNLVTNENEKKIISTMLPKIDKAFEEYVLLERGASGLSSLMRASMQLTKNDANQNNQ